MNISDCKAIVTGGSKGIGFAIAKMIKDGGGSVAITGRDEKALKDSAKEIWAVGIVADVSSEADCRRAVETAASELGGLNVLINNAGVGYSSPIDSFDANSFEKVWATNVRGAALMAREAAHIFKAQNYGNIVNIGSTSGLRGYANGSAYVASKFALRGMSECWRDELRRSNIRVIHINPSEIQTGFGGRSLANLNPKKLLAEDVSHEVISSLTMADRGFLPELTIFATNPF
jgi:3-oxoacyl-[acyl-carrier protein] reductase